MALELADSGSLTHLEHADQESAVAQEQQREREHAIEEVRTSAWYVLTSDPQDYIQLLRDDILNLLEYAKNEADFHRGIAGVLRDQPWVHYGQILYDMRECYRGFDTDQYKDWKGKYNRGIDAIIDKLIDLH